MEYNKVKEMADFMSAFTIFKIPVYLVGIVVEGGPRELLLNFMEEQLKVGCEFTPDDIISKSITLYTS